MRSFLSLVVASGFVLGASSGAGAQSNVDPDHAFAWTENTGWTNWRPDPADGVTVTSTHLAGFVWSENTGWIHLGDGTPVDGVRYGNANGTDFGVNLDAQGNLSGFAWGENSGWINFDTSILGAERARFDSAALRFLGYAWGENIGWVNLDDTEHFVRSPLNLDCRLGTVNAGVGPVADILLVNGQVGDENRVVPLSPGQGVSVSLLEPPTGSGQGRYVLWVWLAAPSLSRNELNAGGQSLGCLTNPIPVQSGGPQPFRCVMSPGLPSIVCDGVVSLPGPASVPFTLNGGGLSQPIDLCIQAVVEDEGSAHPTGFSVSNATVLRIR